MARDSTEADVNTDGDWPAKIEDISDALVIKEGNLTLVTKPDGTIPMSEGHGYGLYHRDCRFLSGYEVRLGDVPLTNVLSSDEKGYASTIVLTNKRFRSADGNTVRKDRLTIDRRRLIPGIVEEEISITNFGGSDIPTVLSVEFRSDFRDIFTIRGVTRGRDGQLLPTQYEDGTLVMSYDGSDGHRRITSVSFEPRPDHVEGGKCIFNLSLGTRESFRVKFYVHVSEQGVSEGHWQGMAPDDERLEKIRESYRSRKECCRKLRTDNEVFDGVMSRSLEDLRLLHMSMYGHVFHSAGVPWYDTLFGRDSAISAMQSILYDTSTVASTLRLLARYQATEYDDRRDAGPGKILHELRVGEKANTGEVPFTPYYGSVDSTPLFLILLCEYVGWTGDQGLYRELGKNVDAALSWMERCIDSEDTGFATYTTRSPAGLYNHGWKDSRNAIMHKDGRRATHPIALAEAQGYFYLAWIRTSELLANAGRKEDAKRLKQGAGRLRRDFNDRFWMSDERYFAQAIDADGLCEVISSNPLQCLWTGIVDEGRAKDMIDRAFQPDMFTGWGIRTLSSQEKRYNPLGYHNGTVWPFDNSIIAAGLRKYGSHEKASVLFGCMYDAARHYPRYRLPELFGGYPRESQSIPVKYPVACSPQAWSAGTIPFFLRSVIGLAPDAIKRKLGLVNPELPEWISEVTINDLEVGDARINLRLRRIEDETMVYVKERGDIDVYVSY